jgi:hypothetical protein
MRARVQAGVGEEVREGPGQGVPPGVPVFPLRGVRGARPPKRRNIHASFPTGFAYMRLVRAWHALATHAQPGIQSACRVRSAS